MEQLSWTEDAQHRSERVYDYAAPFEEAEHSPEAALIKALESTRAFQRLCDVRFLGALDYFLVERPNGAPTNTRYTRAQHSLGVARLSRTYLALKSHPAPNRMLCVAAAMLHDIGHPPFSHTLEPVFTELFGLDHHQSSKAIIKGDTDLGQEVHETLKQFGIDHERLIATLDGNHDPFDGFFSGPINFDTVEGILRCRQYLKMDNVGLTPDRVIVAATNRDSDLSQQVVDEFWRCKHDVYTLMIRSREGVLCDLLFQEIARRYRDSLSQADFLSTEAQIFKKLPMLRDALRKDRVLEVACHVLPKKICYQSRAFFVNRQTSFSSRLDHDRYRQTKTPRTLTLDEFLPA